MSGERSLGDILGEALNSPSSRSPIHDAGRGDSDSLRSLASEHHNSGLDLTGLGRIAELGQALSFARLAAVNGTPGDLRAIVYLYGQLARECRALGDAAAADNYEGQGYLLAEIMAEEGDEDMASMVVASATAVSPGAHKTAKKLREAIV